MSHKSVVVAVSAVDRRIVCNGDNAFVYVTMPVSVQSNRMRDRESSTANLAPKKNLACVVSVKSSKLNPRFRVYLFLHLSCRLSSSVVKSKPMDFLHLLRDNNGNNETVIVIVT